MHQLLRHDQGRGNLLVPARGTTDAPVQRLRGVDRRGERPSDLLSRDGLLWLEDHLYGRRVRYLHDIYCRGCREGIAYGEEHWCSVDYQRGRPRRRYHLDCMDSELAIEALARS